MTITREFRKQGAEKIANLFAWHTTDINYLDEQIAHQEILGRNTSVLARVRRRLTEAFISEVEVLKQDYGFGKFLKQRS